MTNYFVTTKEGGLFIFPVSGASAAHLDDALKNGAVAKRFLRVKGMTGEEAFIALDDIRRFVRQPAAASAAEGGN